MRKKHQPGCPCCEEPEGMCTCSSLTLEITNADLIFYSLGIRAVTFPPEPCEYLEFEGFDAIEGIYNLSWGNPADLQDFFIKVAATNNPVEDDDGFRYCGYAALGYRLIRNPSTCALWVYFYSTVISLMPGESCPPIEEVDFTLGQPIHIPLPLQPGVDPLLPMTLCEPENGNASVESITDPLGLCDTKYYSFDWEITYA